MLADFGPGSAAVPYQLLLSLTGTGPTSVAGLDVPLSADGFFVKTLAGQYPAAMLRPMGLLDEEGRSRIVFPVPAEPETRAGPV